MLMVSHSFSWIEARTGEKQVSQIQGEAGSPHAALPQTWLSSRERHMQGLGAGLLGELWGRLDRTGELHRTGASRPQRGCREPKLILTSVLWCSLSLDHLSVLPQKLLTLPCVALLCSRRGRKELA